MQRAKKPKVAKPPSRKAILREEGKALPKILRPKLDDLVISVATVEKWRGMLTVDELKFLRMVGADYYDPRDAARLVGWPANAATGELHRLMSTPAGGAFMRECQQAVLSGRIMSLSMKALEHVLTYGEDRAKIAAVRTAFEAAAFLGTRADEKAAQIRALGLDTGETVDPARLLALAEQHGQEIERLERMLAEAKGEVVEGTAVEVPPATGEAAGEAEAPWD